MTTAAILPIKSYSRSKTRTELADRAALAERMSTEVIRVLTQVRGVDEIIVVTQEPRAVEAARAAGVRVVDDPTERSHSEAARLGIAAAAGARRVLLVPGDCPLLDASEVDALLDGAGPGVTVVPDRHGTGTNALVLEPPDVMAPSFGPGSCARHAALARRAGAAVRIVSVPSLAFDVDTPADVAELTAPA